MDKPTTAARVTQAEKPCSSLRRLPNPAWFLALGALVLAVVPAQGQYPRARVGEFEVQGFDFAANGGWRTAAARVINFRKALLRVGAVAALNASGVGAPVVRGHFFVPVVPIAFKDAPAPFPVSQYQDLFFSAIPSGGRPWSVKSYYTAESRGNVLIDGNVFNWIPVDSNAAYYADGCNGIGVLAACPTRPRSRFGDLLLAALDSISKAPGGDTVWNRYDNDGPDGIPNSGDDDGSVDVVAFLQPLVDGACGTANIWSHRYVMSAWNGGVPYVTRTPRRGADGNPIPGQFITINSYTIQSAVGGSTACTAGQIMPTGTVTHETGHAFGLPDLYDTDRSSNTQGDGEWSLMASGTYAQPYSPSSFDAWSLVQLGWVTVDTLGAVASRVAAPVQLSNTVYFGSTLESLYFLVENRGAVGTDTAMMNPAFARPKTPGLLLWQIDDARIALGNATNTVNTGTRQGVALIQADNLNQLRTHNGVNRGDAGDPYPGSTLNHAFGLSTFPAAIGWDLLPLGIRFDRMVFNGDGSVSFRYVRRAPSLIAASTTAARVSVNGTLSSRYVEVVASGDTLALAVDSAQVSSDGRTGARFLSWSDGGARNHTIIARVGPPDTLTASFAVTNRLRIVASGPGTVTSSVTGAVGAGVFLDPSIVVHLTVTPAAGAEFIGWKGDTTTKVAPLDVRMSRPFDLTAQFVQTVVVDRAAAARALLGGTQLDAATIAYLDALGNQNGSFDIGDYVAYLHRTGQKLPPSLDRLMQPTGGKP